MKQHLNPLNFLLLALLPLLAACSSSRMKDDKTDSMFRAGDYEGAAARLRKGLEDEGLDGRDGLLYVLDLGLALHAAGKYEESTKAFLQADQLAEIKDYTSLSTEAATLLTTDQIKQYKGEDFENVLINVYLAMNFALQGKREGALVEAKRVNRKLQLMVTEGKRKYKQNAFARYLSAILYEADGNWNDAYVDYKLAAELLPEMKGIGVDLYAMAWKQKERDDMEKWREKYKLTDAQVAEAKKRVSKERPAEIVVLFENGISPRKGPHPSMYSVPKFYPRFNPVSAGEAIVTSAADGAKTTFKEKTERLMDIEAVAIENLDEKWGGILAKKIAGMVAKEAIGGAVDSRTGNSGLGALIKLALYASDQADTRSWQLLPKDLQIARIPVPPGTYTVQVQPLGAPMLPAKTIQVPKAGEKVFVDFRFMP
jgi:hypothetical protein